MSSAPPPVPAAAASVALPSPWVVLAATTAIQAFVSLVALTPPVFATEAAADMGLDPRMVGLYTSLVYLGAMLTSLPGGSVTQRYGAVRLSQVCLGLAFVGLALLAGGFAWLGVVGALLIGFGYGPITPASSHVLARTVPPHRRGLVFSIKQTGVPLGGFAAGLLVPPLVLGLGWQAAALVVGGAALVLAVVLQPLRARLDDDRRATVPLRGAALMGPLRVVWGNKALRLLALASFAFAAAQLSLAAFLVAFLVMEIGLDLVSAGAVLAGAQAGGVVGRVLWGWLADVWLGARRMLVAVAFGMALASAAMALLAATGGEGWTLALVVGVALLFGATGIGWNGVYLAEVARVAPPGQAGAATGGALFVTYAGVVAGPSLFGVLAGMPGGFALAFGVLAVSSALGGLLVLAVRGNE